MVCEKCESEPCTCQTTLPILQRETYHALPLGITKEEFGLDLYDTIRTIGGILGIDQQIAAAIHVGQKKKVSELTQRREALRGRLKNQLPCLSADETNQIVARYPMVVTLALCYLCVIL